MKLQNEFAAEKLMSPMSTFGAWKKLFYSYPSCVSQSRWKARNKARKKPTTLLPLPQSPATHIQQKPLSKIAKWFWWSVGAVTTLIGLLVGIVSLQPSVSVNPDTSLNPQSAFATPFSVCNDSLFSIHNVSIDYAVNRIEAEKNVRFDTFTVLEPERPIIPELRPKETSSVKINFPFGNKPVFCDVSIEVNYRPAFVWWKKEQTFRFITATNFEGQIIWYRKAQSEPGAEN